MAHARFADKLEISDRFDWLQSVPFILIHLSVLGVFWTGFTTEAVIICVTLYAVRVFALTGGYHRYFSHRSYRTSRVFQFILAVLGSMALQRSAVWWAAKHREHHRFSDMPNDAHSPRQYGFVDSHVGWVYRKARYETDLAGVSDLTKYPELMWLHRFHFVPGLIVAFLCWFFAGWSGLVAGFMLSTVLVYHVTFFVNSLAHVVGRQRYLTGDDSRNCWWIALLTFGEGWHNNHHYYSASTRQGFRWYELDISYLILKVLSWFGIVWDLQAPPEHVLRGDRKPSGIVIEKTANHLASLFPVDQMVEQIKEAWEEQGQHMDELRQRARQAMCDAEAYLDEIELPNLPTLDEIKVRAHKMFARVPALDTAVERAHAKLVQMVSMRLIEEAQPVT